MTGYISFRKRFTIAFAVWEGVLIGLFLASEALHFSLSWQIHQIRWALFGVPDNLFGFANTTLPRIIAWLIYSIPPGVLALWLFEKLHRGDSETRCRKCGYILRGISEPRCSECGEGI